MRSEDLTAQFGMPPGVWYVLPESEERFSAKRERPYVFPDGTRGRSILFHALPRTTSEPDNGERDGVDFLRHEEHTKCDANDCGIDRLGWIRPLRFQFTRDELKEGRWSCTEPFDLSRIQTFDLEQVKRP